MCYEIHNSCGDCSNGVYIKRSLLSGVTIYKCLVSGKKVRDNKTKVCGAFKCNKSKNAKCIHCAYRQN